MIIGISGKKQSGKDTVAKIIQGFDIWKRNLALQTEYPLSNVFVRAYVLNRVSIYVSSWEVKKFASKLKEIVSILTGFKVEDLEKEAIKNINLFLSYRLLNKKANTFEIFTSMEDLVERLNHLRTVYLDVYSAEEVNDLFVQETISITPRLLLQTIGTDIVRAINPDIWINSLFQYYTISDLALAKMRRKGFSPISGFLDLPNWIITDVRFPNEAKAIKKKDGLVIRVNRPFYCQGCTIQKLVYQDCMDCAEYQMGIFQKEHKSETALDGYEHFDYIIDNSNCIDCLIEQVKEILKHEKII